MNIAQGHCELVQALQRHSSAQGDVGVYSATMLAIISLLESRKSQSEMQSLRTLVTIVKEEGVKPLLHELSICTRCSLRHECSIYRALSGS